MQEELERKSISVTVQATKLTGRVMRAAIAAALRKIEKERNTPKVGRTVCAALRHRRRTPIRSRLRNGFALLSGMQRNIRSVTMWRRMSVFSPPKWTVYFKANQADAIEAAFKKYTQKTVKRENRPSLLSQLSKFKEIARKLARDPVKNKEHGGPER